jgi:hypothetical protein
VRLPFGWRLVSPRTQDLIEMDLAEMQDFVSAARREIEEYGGAFRRIWEEHQPLAVSVRERGSRLELRCSRCATDEHHTWTVDNQLVWPCPTVRVLLTGAAARFVASDLTTTTTKEAPHERE